MLTGYIPGAGSPEKQSPQVAIGASILFASSWTIQGCTDSGSFLVRGLWISVCICKNGPRRCIPMRAYAPVCVCAPVRVCGTSVQMKNFFRFLWFHLVTNMQGVPGMHHTGLAPTKTRACHLWYRWGCSSTYLLFCDLLQWQGAKPSTPTASSCLHGRRNLKVFWMLSYYILLMVNDDDFVFYCDFGTIVMVLFVFSEHLLLVN